MRPSRLASRRPLRRLLGVLAAVVGIAVVALVAGAASPSGHPADHPVARSAHSVAPAGDAARGSSGVYLESAGGAAVRRASAAHPERAIPETAPLPVAAFDRPIAAYRRYAGRDAVAMAAPAARLTAALRRGDRGAARTAWTAAYRRYLLLGAAYGALGALDDAIDGTPGGLRGGVHDPAFSGLHRVEHDLWTGRRPASIVPAAQRLQRLVARLPARVRTVEITPLDYATRAHEILEDAQRDFLSDRAAPWSSAGVVATAASVDATGVVLGTLRPILQGRGDALEPVETRMGQLRGVLAGIRRGHHGTTPRLDALGSTERARLTGALGAALEALAAVPGTLETVLPPDVPKIPESR
ncbi:EfeM/EfeO family lipoprotein [Patulibacter sp. NPDC049589]|uniref:EfeM/EfeO family lipoprotein n=1 Tax=Patulibacter sp. NPDC049589 TaxID=3154731 RepID=UPI00342DC814